MQIIIKAGTQLDGFKKDGTLFLKISGTNTNEYPTDGTFEVGQFPPLLFNVDVVVNMDTINDPWFANDNLWMRVNETLD